MMAESLRKVLTPLRAVNDEYIGERKSPSTTGGGGDGLEPRIAKLEAHVEHIKTSVNEVRTDLRDFQKQSRSEFYLIFGAIIATTLGLATIIAKGFHWL
jgi:hypothetical protein